MLISTQISSYLIPSEIWISGYAGIPALDLPARDALDIERRWRKGVVLRNEARRYTICCERMQAITRELALTSAPISEPNIWHSYECGSLSEVRALAHLAVSEYLRRFYSLKRPGQGKPESKRGWRMEALFHPPGKGLSDFLSLLTYIRNEPKFSQICTYASQKAKVASMNFTVSSQECEAAFERRYSLISKCVRESLGIVDVFELV